jgi:hypothetical protein
MTVLRNPKHAAERFQTGVKQPTETARRRRRPTRVDTLIRQAEKAGKVHNNTRQRHATVRRVRPGKLQ